MKKGRCEDIFMGQPQRFSNYFFVCGGVETDPCKWFLQNWIETKCPYLGLPPSSNNRKIHPRFCQNLRKKSLSIICDEDKTAHFNFAHHSWSNLVPFIMLVPNFLVFWKENSILYKIRCKKPAWEPAQVDHGESPSLSGLSYHTACCLHAHRSCISGLGRGDVADVIQWPWFLIYSHKQLDMPCHYS